MGEAMVLEEGEVEGVLPPPPERLEPVEAGADLLERPPDRLLAARLGTARLGAERLAEARLGAWRLPERTGELLLTGVATTGMAAPGLGLAAGAGLAVTAAGATAAAGTTATGATTGLALAGWGEAAPAGGWLEAPAPGAPAGAAPAGAEAAAGAFAAESAGELAAFGLGSGGVEEAMAGEIRTRKAKLGRGPWASSVRRPVVDDAADGEIGVNLGITAGKACSRATGGENPVAGRRTNGIHRHVQLALGGTQHPQLHMAQTADPMAADKGARDLHDFHQAVFPELMDEDPPEDWPGLAGLAAAGVPAAAALAASGSQWSMMPTIVKSLG